MMNKLKNEKGVTLTEVIAVLAIVSIIGISAYSFFSTTLQTNQMITNKEQLNKEALLILSTIENAFYGNDSLLFENNNGTVTMSPEGSNPSQLNSENIIFQSFIINGQAVDQHGQHVYVEPRDDGLSIKYVISMNGTSYTSEVSTSFVRYDKK